MGNCFSFNDCMNTNNTIGKCPQCKKKNMLSYPTTTCTHCETVYENNIKPVKYYLFSFNMNEFLFGEIKPTKLVYKKGAYK